MKLIGWLFIITGLFGGIERLARFHGRANNLFSLVIILFWIIAGCIIIKGGNDGRNEK